MRRAPCESPLPARSVTACGMGQRQDCGTTSRRLTTEHQLYQFIVALFAAVDKARIPLTSTSTTRPCTEQPVAGAPGWYCQYCCGDTPSVVAPCCSSSSRYHFAVRSARSGSAIVPQTSDSVRVVSPVVLVRWASLTALA